MLTAIVTLHVSSLPRIATNASSLPWSDVNILIVTDVHSWLAGHAHPDHTPVLDADYGDVLSLYERLAATAAKSGRDLFFVQNGDLNDGTGLSRIPPATLVPLIQKMPFDALTTGNHELYKNVNIEYLTRPGGFVDSWKGAYLASNVLNATTHEPLGARSKLLVGRATGVRLLTFGFLYDMPDHCDGVALTLVEDAVKEAWFIDALKRTSEYDALLFLAHMDFKDRLVDLLLRAVRAVVGARVPVQFVTGHSHIRAYRDLDRYAASFEAGHYLDTVGFASFARGGLNGTTGGTTGGGTGGGGASFAHVDIDANVAAMAAAAGLDGPASLATPAGTALSTAIAQTASSMGLDRVIGCSPIKYVPYSPLGSPDSLWALYLYNVTATEALGGNASRIVIESTGSLRYDLYAGNVTTNDLWTITPFADRLWRVAPRVSGDVLAAIMRDLNGDSDAAAATVEEETAAAEATRREGSGRRGPREHVQAVASGALPAYATTSTPERGAVYEVWTLDFDLAAVGRAFQARANQSVAPKLMLGGRNTTTLWESWIERSWPC